MKKLILILLLPVYAIHVQAQNQAVNDEIIYSHIINVVDNAVSNLQPDSDPYGFSLTVKTSKSGSNGQQMMLYNLDESRIQSIVEQQVMQRLQFAKYNLETTPRTSNSEGVFFMMIGLTPVNAPETGYDVTSGSLTDKGNSVEFGFNGLVVQVSAIFLVSTPNNGAVLGKVYYYDKNGNQREWGNTDFPTSPAEKKAKVRYRRLGPGDDNSNSGAKEPETDWKPVGNTSGSNFEISDRTPGHYFPSVKMRGCIQIFENQGVDPEAIVKVEGNLNWENKASARATHETNKDVYTKYSKGNTVKGEVLDASNRPVKGNKRVILEPKDWETPGVLPAECLTSDENFEFTNVESGVYYLYVKGQPRNEQVEVCNCKGKGPNATYIQNIGGSTACFVTIETTYTKTEDLDPQVAGDFGNSGPGKVVEISKTKKVLHITEVEIVYTNNETTYAKSIDDYTLESQNKFSLTSQVPMITTEGWESQNESYTNHEVAQISFPTVYQIEGEESSDRKYQMSDVFSVIPMFSDPYQKKDMDFSEVQDQGARSMLESMNKLANELGPLADEANKVMNEGEYKEKVKPGTFTFGQLIDASQGKGQISLSDKAVRRIETQVENMNNMGSENAKGFNELSKYYNPGSDEQKHMSGSAKLVNGGFDNFVMFNKYNRPVTTTETRSMIIRKATEAEVREAGAKPTEEIMQEVLETMPDFVLKSVKIIY
jgi:hypothetical protein